MANSSGNSGAQSITTAGGFCAEFQKTLQAVDALHAAFQTLDGGAVLVEVVGRAPTPLPQVSGACVRPLWTLPEEAMVGEIDKVLADVETYIRSVRDALTVWDQDKTLVSQLGSAGT